MQQTDREFVGDEQAQPVEIGRADDGEQINALSCSELSEVQLRYDISSVRLKVEQDPVVSG